MISHTRLITECHHQTVLLECLKYTRPNHEGKNVSGVISLLEKYKAQNCFGFIDKDKRLTHPYLKNFELYKRWEFFEVLIYKKQYIVLACNDLDRVIFDIATDLQVDFDAHQIPKDFKRFMKKVKSPSLKNDILYKNFINTLLQKKSTSLTKLKEFIDSNYKV